jgi:hypothetical protein
MRTICLWVLHGLLEAATWLLFGWLLPGAGRP